MYKKGFTLIELLVVIFIIGLLAAIITVSVNGSRQKTRDARRIADVNSIRDALEMYADAHSGKYPILNTALPPADCSSYNKEAKTTDSGWVMSGIPNLVPTYINVLPVDPRNDSTYFYSYFSCATGAQYKVSANKMESDEGKAKAANSSDGGSHNDNYEVFSSGAADRWQ